MKTSEVILLVYFLFLGGEIYCENGEKTTRDTFATSPVSKESALNTTTNNIVSTANYENIINNSSRENNSTTESITWSTPVANTQENNNSSMAPTSTPDVTNSTTVKTNETFSTPGDIINSTSKTQPPVTNSTEKTDISTGSTVIDENTTRSSEITSETSMSSPTETAKAKKNKKGGRNRKGLLAVIISLVFIAILAAVVGVIVLKHRKKQYSNLGDDSCVQFTNPLHSSFQDPAAVPTNQSSEEKQTVRFGKYNN